MWPPSTASKETSSVLASSLRPMGAPTAVLAAGLWQKNVDSSIQPTRRFKWEKENDSPKSKSCAETTNDGKATTKTLRLARTVILSAVLSVYFTYPVAILWLFRIPEQFSLWGMFQNYHQCSGTLHRNIHACVAVAGKDVLLLLPSLCVIWLWCYSMFSTRRKIQISFMGFVLGLSMFKLSVDYLFLFGIPQQLSLEGKIAVITGANGGIGFATALALASQGAHVVVTCRSMAKCQPVVDQINQGKSNGSASAAVLDLKSLESVSNLTQHLSRSYPSIHYFFANAGTTPQYELTQEGFEDAYGMHLAHSAVVLGILPSLKRSGTDENPARVVIVSSEMAINAAIGIFGNDLLFSSKRFESLEQDLQDDWRGERTRGDGNIGPSLPAYSRAKLCGVLFALELNRRMKRSQIPVIAHAVHTGAVVTDSSRGSILKIFPERIPGLQWMVGNFYFPLLWRTVNGGAKSLLCPALSQAPHILHGGQYLDALCRPFYHDVDADPTARHEITIPLGKGLKRTVTFSPVLALLLADVQYSERLWNVSVIFLENSPAQEVVQNLANYYH